MLGGLHRSVISRLLSACANSHQRFASESSSFQKTRIVAGKWPNLPPDVRFSRRPSARVVCATGLPRRWGRAWARGAGALLLSTARRRLACLGGGAPLEDASGPVRLCANVRGWSHFDYDGRYLCYSFGMGECNDLSPALNAEFMYLERLGPLCSSKGG